MAKSLSIHQRIIRKPGDTEVVGKWVPWAKGSNSLADAFEEALNRDSEESSSGLRRTAKQKEKRSVVR